MAAQKEASGEWPINTGEYAQDLGPAGTDQPRQTEDFARSNSEGDVGDDACNRQGLNPEFLMSHRRPSGNRLIEVDVAEHGRDERCLVPIGRGPRRHQRAVAHHRYAIAEPEHIVQIVRDENNAKPLAPQTADDAIQLLALRFPQRRGRLVHDQDAVFCFQCPHDLKQLLAGDGKRSRARIGIERYAETIGQFAESPDRGAVVEERTPGLLLAEEDVGRGGQFGQDRPLLVDDSDAGLLAARAHARFPARVRIVGSSRCPPRRALSDA